VTNSGTQNSFATWHGLRLSVHGTWALPNPYEVPGCQESKVSRQWIFAFFAAFLMLASLAIGRVS
jgi:hypothetical protein